MADSFSALGSAIYAKIAPVNGSAIYDTLAPSDVQPPFEIFQRMTGTDWHTFNTRGENLEYMIKSVSDRDWQGVAYARYGTIHATVEDATFTITGFTQLRFRRISTINYQDKDLYWHAGGIYRVELQTP